MEALSTSVAALNMSNLLYQNAVKTSFFFFNKLIEVAVVLIPGYTLKSLWELFKKYVSTQAQLQTN